MTTTSTALWKASLPNAGDVAEGSTLPELTEKLEKLGPGSYECQPITRIMVPEPPPKPVDRVNPFGIAYKTNTNVQLYAKPGGLVVAGRCASHSTSVAMKNVRAKGGEVLQYLIPNEVPDNGGACALDREYYHGGAVSKVPLWPWPKSAPGTRRKWAGAKITDMRPGSPWIAHTLAFVERIINAGTADGLYLDTVGARTYAKLAQWESWSREEKDAYTLGHIELVRKLDELRKRTNPGFILVNNSVWHRDDAVELARGGERYVNGVCLEHHDPTSGWHRNYAARAFGNPEKRRVLIIADNQTEARQWAKVPGVTHVSGQSTQQYKSPLTPAIGFNVEREEL